jgi:hypothetical protein
MSLGWHGLSQPFVSSGEANWRKQCCISHIVAKFQSGISGGGSGRGGSLIWLSCFMEDLCDASAAILPENVCDMACRWQLPNARKRECWSFMLTR